MRLWLACRRAGSVGLGLVMWTAAVVAQAPAPNEFVPQSSLPKQEVPAAPLLYGAYALVWGVLVVYLFFLWRRIGRVERELGEVNRKLRQQ